MFVFMNKEDIRRRPYLPNFRRMPAKIIDPATGASTCAFGSQRWKKYKGILTIKAVIVITHHNLTKKEELEKIEEYICENINK